MAPRSRLPSYVASCASSDRRRPGNCSPDTQQRVAVFGFDLAQQFSHGQAFQPGVGARRAPLSSTAVEHCYDLRSVHS